MTIRTLHTILGLLLLAPFLAWIVTAMVFYLKPGYAEAYASLPTRTYPLGALPSFPPDSAWREIRYFRTILGEHLLVRTSDGWLHLDPSTLRPRPAPSAEEIRTLVEDAVGARSARYGSVGSVSGDTVLTTTGVAVTVDWARVSLSQRGPDTDRIDLLYRIHYLQWTGVPALDKVLGPAGLALVLGLSLLGVRLALQKRRRSPP